jgi:uncharacterized membrane protein/thiol-disulfide isomerase/thioredoxin
MHAARWFVSTFVLTAALAACSTLVHAQPTVRAVLFFSPTCPHCHTVMEQHLPPLMDRFGGRLQVITIDASTPDGGRLYQDVVQAFDIPRSRLGVPALVVGDRVLVGADEIPQRLPGIVAAGLAAGGIDWPEVASIRGALARAGLLEPLPAPAAIAAPPQAAPQPTQPPAPPVEASVPAPSDAPAREETPAAIDSSAAAAGSMADAAPAAGQVLRDVTDNVAPASVRQRFMRDPAGNGVAVLVLAGMLLTLAWSVHAVRSPARAIAKVPPWLVPVLVLCGLAVASYLSFVEVTGSKAACGPVGDCNTVQQSPYATLFGFLPVGVLGLFGYAAMGGAWVVGRHGPPRRRRLATMTLWLAALVGTAFSAYLTFLEPFVIGASCVWCLTSAAVTAVILMAATVGVTASRHPAAVLSHREQRGSQMR